MPPIFGTCSIGGIVFRVPLPGTYLPLPVTEVVEEITHIPYSTINVVDSGGLGVSRWQSPVKVDSDDRTAFEAMNGQTGLTFILYGTELGPARLMITSASVWAASAEVHYLYDVDIIF